MNDIVRREQFIEGELVDDDRIDVSRARMTYDIVVPPYPNIKMSDKTCPGESCNGDCGCDEDCWYY